MQFKQLLISFVLALAAIGQPSVAQIGGSGIGIGNGPTFTGITGSTQCLHANSAGVISGTGADCGSSSASGANPSGTVGLSTVNGSAATFLRSDGAPALSQSITPTWTGLHKYTFADFALLGSSTGYTLLESGLSGASNNTLLLPVTASDTLAALGTVQNWTATQSFATINATGGTHTGLTGLAIRDTSAAFDVTLVAASSTNLTAGRSLTFDLKNVAHTLAFGATANTITFPNTSSYTLIGSADSGTVTNAMLAGSITLANLATQATNTIDGNATSGSASPTALAIGSCSTSTSALIWTTNTGFGCNTSINAATLGGATFASPGTIGGGTPGIASFTTLNSTVFAFAAGTAFSGASWATTSPVFNGAAMTLNDTTASGTVTTEAAYSLQAPTFTSTGGASTTITNPTTLWLAAPLCSGGVVCTNFTSLITAGKLQAQSGIIVTGNTINLNASSNSAVNVGTGTNTQLVTIGGGSNAVTVNATTLTLGGSTLITSSSPFTNSNAAFKLTGITTGTNADTVCLKADGTLLIQAAACTISSLRFKKEVKNLDGSTLPVIANMRVASFRMKGGETNVDPNAASKQVGLIAENIARVAPECAIYERDMKTPKSYRQECVIALLVKGMQEQQGEVGVLIKQNAVLKSRITQLEAR